MNLEDKILWILAYLAISLLAHKVAMKMSKGLNNAFLRFAFVLSCTVLSIPFFAILFVVLINNSSKHEKW